MMAGILSALRKADEALSGAFDLAFAPAHNPWRHLGGLAFLCLVTAIASGSIAYALYDTSVAGAYQSGLRLQNDPLQMGRLLRGMHRYAADACLLLTVLHLMREGVRGHFRGVRWFSWLTGLPLLWLLWIAGITGLWLLWDARAMYSVTATAEWLQALPIGADLLARNFLTSEALNDRFFSLIIFIHIGVPLLLLAGTWVHVQRISQPRMWPPRALTLSSLGMLALLALVSPATSLGPAEAGHVSAVISLDWFYMALHPLVDWLSAPTVWLLVTGLTLAMAMLPLLRVPRAMVRRAAMVDLDNCNGCARCAADCPFGAVVMIPRANASRHALQASVNPDLCAACGICAGACPSSTPFRRIEDIVSGIEMPDLPIALLRQQLKGRLGALQGTNKVVIFTCRQAASLNELADTETAVVELECAAMLPPSFAEYALRLGAVGVVIAGCKQGDCEFRLGDQWLHQRLLGQREPRLRGSVPRERVKLVWSGRAILGVQAAIAQVRQTPAITQHDLQK